MTVHNHGIDPSCRERLVGECLLKPGAIVLDWHPNPTQLPGLLKTLRANFWTSLADQIEAQTKPLRIPEPGLWGVVDAAGPWEQGSVPATAEWVRVPGGIWRRTDNGFGVAWSELLDPVLVREGISE